ncbi:MAG: glycosyltransferase family 2 protein [Pararhodobacter sp.]
MSSPAALSVIVPACDEAGYIDACLHSLLAAEPADFEVIVVANGCTDDTATRARRHQPAFAARGNPLRVLELPALGKPGALNAGDAEARHGARVYLDADVTLNPPLLRQLAEALAGDAPRYASGQPEVLRPRSAISRAYARFWVRLPFVAQGVPGFGLFAVNAAGRARWGAFPPIISDDTFVRLHFAPAERIGVTGRYQWPLVEGLRPLVRVRRRQDQGVAEIAALYPGLIANDDTPRPGIGWLLGVLLRDPAGFAVYGVVSLAVRLGRGAQSGWVRGR